MIRERGPLKPAELGREAGGLGSIDVIKLVDRGTDWFERESDGVHLTPQGIAAIMEAPLPEEND